MAQSSVGVRAGSQASELLRGASCVAGAFGLVSSARVGFGLVPGRLGVPSLPGCLARPALGWAFLG